jgi:hypothetical protein
VKEPSASSTINRPQLLDDAVMNNLNSDSSYLYQMPMSQPENEPIEIDVPTEVFGYQETIQLFIEDVVELFKEELLNVSILQFFCK